MKKISNLKPIPAVLLATFALSACGGGGGDSASDENSNATQTTTTPTSNDGNNGNGGGTTTQPPAPTPMTISVDTSTAAIDELDSTVFVITANDVEGTLAADTSGYTGDGTVTTAINGSVITITYQAAELQRDAIETIPVVVTDDDDTENASLTITLTNASAEAVIEDYQTLASAAENTAALTSDIALIGKSYAAIQYLVGDINRSQKNGFDSSIDTAVEAATSLFENDESVVTPDYIAAQITKYQNGELNESALVEAQAEALRFIAQTNTNLLSLINDVAEGSSTTPALPDYMVTVQGKGVSGFIGNPTYGEWRDETWVFSDDYSIIADAASTPCFSAE